MYLLYVDHSGELASLNDKHFVMAGAAIFERQVYHLKKALDELQQTLLPEITGPVELHASQIRNRHKPLGRT